MFDIIYNGQVLPLRVEQGFTRGLMVGEFENNYIQIAEKDGVTVVNSRIKEGRITIPVRLTGDVYKGREGIAKAHDELMGILNVDGPKQLIFSDQPDRYYVALPDSKPTADEIQKWLERGEITFLVPDGIAYAVEEKLISNDPHDPRNYPELGRNTFTAETQILSKSNVTSISRTDDPNGFTFTGTQSTPRGLRMKNLITGNGQWTVSGKMRGTKSTNISMTVDINNLGSTVVTSKPDNEFTFFKVTVNVNNWSDDLYNFVDFEKIEWKVYHITEFKVERGPGTPFSYAPEDPKVISGDLKGKVTESTLANPIIARYLTSPTFPNPNTGLGVEFTQVNYDRIKILGGEIFETSTAVVGNSLYVAFEWPMTEIIYRALPELQTLSTVELKKLITRTDYNMYARGSSSTGNDVRASVWDPTASQLKWLAWGSNLTSELKNIKVSVKNSNTVSEPSGKAYTILNAQPTTSTGQSTINVDYASIDIFIRLPRTGEIVVINSGTNRTSPEMEFDFESDNGYIGVIAENGIIQYGNPAEVDKVPDPMSINLIADRFDFNDGWAINSADAVTRETVAANGTFKWDPNQSFGYPTSFGTGASNHGVTLTRKLSQTAKNFSLKTLSRMQDIYADRVGMLEMTLSSADKTKLFTVQVRDYSDRSSQSTIRCFVGDQVVYDDTVTWDWRWWIGNLDVQKLGNVWEWTIAKKRMQADKRHWEDDPHKVLRQQFVDGGNLVSNKELDRVTLSFCAFGDYLPIIWEDLGVKELAIGMGWSELHLTKNIPDNMKDIPNKMSAGDTVQINNTEGKIYKFWGEQTPVMDMIDADIGSQYFPLEVGENRIQFFFSNFMPQPPLITLRYREVYR